MSNDAEERARKVLADVLKLNEAQRVSFNDGNLIPIIFPSDAIDAMVAFAAEARSHDGGWVRVEEAASYLDGYAGGHYMAQSCAAALRGHFGSAVPLFDEGRETG